MRFTGWQEEIIDALIKAGVVETKAEALRLALFRLALDFGVVDSRKVLKTLQKELSKRPMGVDEVLASVERAKRETVR